MRTSAILLAAGKGSRFGKPKQFVRVHGKPIYAYSLERFLPLVDEVILVIPPGFDMREIPDIERYSGVKVVEGGNERYHSSYSGLRSASGEIVLIHDTARALISRELIERVLDGVVEKGNAVPVVPVRDTIRRRDGVEVDRSNLFAVQTPQGFRRKDILRAYERAFEEGDKGTDDAYFYRKYVNSKINFVPGDSLNFKITYPEDLIMFERLVLVDSRVGFGWDVHPVEQGREFFIAGVKVAEDFGPVGHSDGDSLTHAIIDALLGAAGRGNIGQIFPDTEQEFSGINSLELLKKTMEIVSSGGWRVLNVDAVAILEKPRIGGFLDEIVSNLSSAMDVLPDRISIKPKSGNRVRTGVFEAQVVVRIGKTL